MRIARISAGTAAAAALFASVLVVVPASHASPTRMIDESNVTCSNGSRMETSLERSRGRLEVDVDIERGRPRESWTVKINRGGTRVHTVTRTTDREGDFDFTRYLSDGTARIVVKATSASGETCRAVLRP